MKPLITFCGSRKYDSILRIVSEKLKNSDTISKNFDILIPHLNEMYIKKADNYLTIKGIVDSNCYRLIKSDIIIFIIDLSKSSSGISMTDFEIGYLNALKNKKTILLNIIDKKNNIADTSRLLSYAIFDHVLDLETNHIYDDLFYNNLISIIEQCLKGAPYES